MMLIKPESLTFTPTRPHLLIYTHSNSVLTSSLCSFSLIFSREEVKEQVEELLKLQVCVINFI